MLSYHQHSDYLIDRPLKSSILNNLSRFNLTPLDSAAMSPFLHPGNDLVSPVPGIEMHNGFKCRLCPYYAAKRDTIHRHLLNIHRGDNSGMISCQVQALFRGFGRVYFGVDRDQVVPQPEELVENSPTLSEEQTDGMHPYLQQIGFYKESTEEHESSEDMKLRIGNLSLHLNTRFTKVQLKFVNRF